MQAGNVIALTRKFQHEGQGILAAGQGDEDAVLVGEQLSGFDAAGDLRGEEIPETVSQNPVLWLGREMMAVADLQRLHIMMRRTPGQGAVARCGLDGPA